MRDSSHGILTRDTACPLPSAIATSRHLSLSSCLLASGMCITKRAPPYSTNCFAPCAAPALAAAVASRPPARHPYSDAATDRGPPEAGAGGTINDNLGGGGGALGRLDQVLLTMKAKKVQASLRTCERVAAAAVRAGCGRPGALALLGCYLQACGGFVDATAATAPGSRPHLPWPCGPDSARNFHNARELSVS